MAKKPAFMTKAEDKKQDAKMAKSIMKKDAAADAKMKGGKGKKK